MIKNAIIHEMHKIIKVVTIQQSIHYRFLPQINMLQKFDHKK